MKKVCIVLLILTTFVSGVFIGAKGRQKVLEERALKLPDDIECFTNQDIEYILYNTPMQIKRN